jgi:hypothetical protein
MKASSSSSPRAFTYTNYIEEDFGAIGRACGLTHTRDINAFISKVMVFDKPAR